MTDPRIGRDIGDRFHLTSRVGEGGMGVVYIADDKVANSQAAVKFLHSHLTENEDFVARFRQEGRSASRFKHPNAVQILDMGDDEFGVPWLAMEYCGGKSLKRLLKDEAPLEIQRACAIGKQILSAVGEAHKNGIIHRDLKPENIKVEAGPGGAERVKVLDFGVAKFIGTEDMEEMTGAVKTKTGVVFGTPKYMAPEQILGEQVDGRSDIYSVGAIIYEMLTGSAPFPSEDIMGFITKHLKEPVEPPTERAPEQKIPAALEELVLQTLEKDRGARPARATDVADKLTDLAEGTTAEAEDAGEAKPGPLGAVFLGGGVLGAVLAAVVASGQAGGVVTTGVALGIGATVAYFLRPRVGEIAFLIRALVVTGIAVVAAAISALALATPGWLAIGLAIGSILIYVLYSAGWGRQHRLQAFLLGGLVAPLVAIPLLPFPTGKGYVRIWDLGTYSMATLGPALAILLLAVGFAVTAFLAPLPGERAND